MANAIFEKALGAFLTGSLSWTDDNMKAALIDVTAWALDVAGVSNTAPIVVSTSSPHNLDDNDLVSISDVIGNTQANGLFRVAVVSALEFELVDTSGNGDYISGGFVVNLSEPDNLNDIPTLAVVASSELIDGKYVQGSAAFADIIRFEDVEGAVCRAVVIYKDTGSTATSTLVGYFDRGTNLPLTPNGFPVQLNWGDDALFALSQ